MSVYLARAAPATKPDGLDSELAFQKHIGRADWGGMQLQEKQEFCQLLPPQCLAPLPSHLLVPVPVLHLLSRFVRRTQRTSPLLGQQPVTYSKPSLSFTSPLLSTKQSQNFPLPDRTENHLQLLVLLPVLSKPPAPFCKHAAALSRTRAEGCISTECYQMITLCTYMNNKYWSYRCCSHIYNPYMPIHIGTLCSCIYEHCHICVFF